MSKLINEYDYFYNLSEDEQVKELYAQFGLCVYWFQVLEHQLIDMIILSAQKNGLIISSADFDNLFYSFSDKSMGMLKKKVFELYDLSEKDIGEINNIQAKRNYYVHNYFKNHSEDFFDITKKLQMLSEFIDTAEQIRSVDKKLENLCNNSLEKIGITQDILDSLLLAIKNGNFESDDNLKFGKRNKT